ncbi:MAG TPA: DNA gyrase C-terminal beta-propeller domain-containing protein, partial [Candidatus Binatia bacterium]|nr:DNA gyrase C-terminal beta-propeller domain-containing protein [Candidatus Binatia bacterium]
YGEPIQTLFNFQDGERVVMATLAVGEASPANGKSGDTANDTEQGELFPDANEENEQAESQPQTDSPLYLLATAQGLGFRFRPNLEETTRSGRKVARLSDDDEVVSIEPVNSGRAICASAAGKMLAFAVEDVSELSGPGRGVILMRLDEDDRLIGAVTSSPGHGVIVTKSDGDEREVRLKDIPLGHRAGKGQRVLKRMTLASVRGVVEDEGVNNGRA